MKKLKEWLLVVAAVITLMQGLGVALQWLRTKGVTSLPSWLERTLTWWRGFDLVAQILVSVGIAAIVWMVFRFVAWLIRRMRTGPEPPARARPPTIPSQVEGRPATAAAREMARLSDLASKGQAWADSLRNETIDDRRWELVDSVPSGMVRPTSMGLVTAWPGGPPGYEDSGFLVAQLELDEGDFCVEFETRVDQYGSGWDAGVHLLHNARPRSKVCAALRYLPAPWSGADHDALCLLLDDEKVHPFLLPFQEWVHAKLEISGQTCQATVNNHVVCWRSMGSRPQRLVVGATPVDWHAEGQEARCLFRELAVRPRRLG